MRLLPGVHLVGGGRLGSGLSNAYDSNVYLADGPDGAVVIDSGSGLESHRIVETVVAATPAVRIVGIAVTHAHADHAGGAAALATAFDRPVFAGAATARLIERGDPDELGLTAAIRGGIYPSAYRFTPAADVHTATPEQLAGTGLRAEVIPTPGHSADHTCYLLDDGQRRLLFTGDLVFARGRIALLGTEDSSPAALHRSLHLLRDLRPDVLLPGHGSPVLSDASWHLERAIHAFELGQLPGGFS